MYRYLEKTEGEGREVCGKKPCGENALWKECLVCLESMEQKKNPGVKTCILCNIITYIITQHSLHKAFSK